MTVVRARAHLAGLVAAGVLAATSRLGAQAATDVRSGGFSGITPTISAALIRASERGLGEWVRAIVLFRTPAPPLFYDASASRARQERANRFREAWRASREQRRGFSCGGGGSNDWWYDVECTIGMDTLTIAGSRFPLTDGESALVLMIDQPDQDPATWKVMGTGRVSAFPPDGFFVRQWRSGDTLFTESSANPAALMLRYLQQSAVVRAFIEGRGR